jgi:FMN phosphatase YigB (HAD superfamily)
MTPSVVVFDLGKIFLDFDYEVAARKIAARGGVSTEKVKESITRSPAIWQFETGTISKEQFFTAVCQVTGFKGTIDEFGRLFGDIFTPIEPMIRLNATLRHQGIPTYIFSNTNEWAIAHVRRGFPFFADFDGYIFSYEHGVMKPDARLYEVVERQTGRRNAEIFYVDDLPENVAAGAARGWQAFLHESPEKTRAAMVKLGLRV